MEARDIVGIVVAVIGIGVTVGTVLWRLAASVAKVQTQVEGITIVVGEVRGILQERAAFDERLKKVEAEVAKSRASIHEIRDMMSSMRGQLDIIRYDRTRPAALEPAPPT